MSLQQSPRNEGSSPSVLGILFSPGEEFERIREKPRFGVALVTILVLSIVCQVFVGIALVENPAYQEQYALEEAGMSSEIVVVGVVIAMMIAGLFLIPITLLLRSLFHWLFILLFRGEATFKQVFSLNTHLFILPVLSLFVYMIFLWATGGGGAEPELYPTSLAAFVPGEGFVGGLLSGIEIFAIWELILTAGGLAVIGGLSKGKGWTIALIIFVATLLITSGFEAVLDAADTMTP
ncbi:YIP1 family protein [Kroppenstedtia pulmonis]|uniref:YIP1 family protein n=1 Tax=Kroppenstedtia pulmonis TaxID=1380685 RepID=A0A7D4CPV8_9BACL|nr:YIP1 family protein [Kroppenstedtia pulmonis]QKG85638.1 YIP1 family protein [Kroppenstedtia pulmonis]